MYAHARSLRAVFPMCNGPRGGAGLGLAGHRIGRPFEGGRRRSRFGRDEGVGRAWFDGRRLDPRESRRGDLDLGNRLAARAGQRWKPELAGLFRRARYRLMAWTAAPPDQPGGAQERSEEHTSELQSLMRISYAVFCLKKKI